MIMGVGLLMMGAGAVLLVVDIILMIIAMVKAPGEKKRMSKYLRERY